MSDTRKDLPPVSAANFLARVREVLQVYLGSQGSELDRGLTVRDIVGTGLAALNPNGGSDTLLVPSVPTGGTGGGSSEVYEPDLTIPPASSSFTAVAGLTSILVETEPPIYSAGHGHGVARLFGVTRLSGDPLPTFSAAVELGQFQGDVFSYATGPGKIWHLWLIWRSKDGVDSAPAGGTNGVSVTTGKIGNADLNSAIIEAANLASGAIDASKFTSTIEPVTLVTSVPGTKQTSTIFNTTDGKLYRWNGTAYVASVLTSDLSGTVTGSQIAANTITAGNLAAGSVTASKMFITGAGAALNADPNGTDATAWNGSPVMLTGLTDVPFGSTAIANAVGSSKNVLSAELIPVEQAKRYRIEALVKQVAGSGGILYLGVVWYDATGSLLVSNSAQPSGAGSPAGWSNGTYSYFGLIGAAAPGTWTRYVTSFGSGETCAIPSNAKFMRISALLNYSSSGGVQHAVTGFKVMEKADADLIVDGSIIASKLAANAIAVGTAAVQNGAIVNAMIGTTAIDDAKIANLSAAKLTAGDGTIGGDLKSSGFVAGSDGWIVRPNGTAEFGFAHIRGTLLASQVAADFITATMIDARGLSIKDASGNVILSAGSAIDWTKLGGASSNLSGLGYTGALDATRNVYRGAWSTATVYKAGDVTTNAGSSWSARVDHTSSNGTNNPPTLPTTSNTWWELSAAKGDIGSTGPASISAVLSNEAHVFPAAADGTVSSYTGSGTEIRVYEGATELAYDGVGTANGTWKVTSAVVNITAGTLTDSGTYLTVGAHAGVAAGTDTSSITYTITGKTASGTGFTLTKTQTFTKSKQGAGGSTGLTGPAGPAVVVNTSRATTFTSTDGALDAAQADIVFTATVSGVSSPAYVWSFSGFQTAPTNSGSATQTITAAQFGTAKAATVRLTVNGTYQDDVTIVRLEKSTAAAGATVGAPAGTTVGGTAAETVAVKALAALQKTGDTITGRINMSVADGLFAGTDLNNGIYLGNSGLVGKKAGVTTFAVDTAGNAVFAGEIAAGSIDVEKLSGTSTSYDTPGTYSFTLPAGFTVMRVTLWAGGGGGGGARSIVGKHDYFPYQACGGGGGQGGRFVATFTGLTPGATYTVVVGAGGSTGQVVLDNSGVYTAPASAASGGNSSISGPGISAVAYGGAGGTSGYPINWGGDYVSGSGGSGGAGGGAGSDGAAGTGYAGGVEDGGTGGGNRNIVFGDWTTTPLETLGIGGNGLRGYGAIYGGPLGHRDPESGRGGFCQIEAYNPNGIIKRSEWDTLIAHLNARFTSYTWP